MNHTIKRTALILLLAALSLVLAACATGEAGPPGPQGPAGPPGPQGPAGPASGGSVAQAEYVGSETCAQCHEDIYANFSVSGHPFKLNEVVDGQAPEYPFSNVPEPPEGYTWDDILYVIGGYGWKARFIDKEGYIITGDAEATTQYNLYNEDLDMGDDWVAYHAGEAELPYDCGECHTTGYEPVGNQNDLPGLVGTWEENGVQCEACHGPGGAHVQNPTSALPVVDRGSEACGECHYRGDPEKIDASGAFVQHHEQYEDFYQSKHRALSCVDCHDPHATTVYREEAVRMGLESGIEVKCESCHWEQETFQPAEHAFATCLDCHMAPLAKSAVGDEARLRGDVASHLFAINPYTTEQFYEEDGNQYSYGYLTVPYACSRCHGEGGRATVKSVEDLMAFAQGYHDPERSDVPLLEYGAEATEEGEGEGGS